MLRTHQVNSRKQLQRANVRSQHQQITRQQDGSPSPTNTAPASKHNNSATAPRLQTRPCSERLHNTLTHDTDHQIISSLLFLFLPPITHLLFLVTSKGPPTPHISRNLEHGPNCNRHINGLALAPNSCLESVVSIVIRGETPTNAGVIPKNSQNFHRQPVSRRQLETSTRNMARS